MPNLVIAESVAPIGGEPATMIDRTSILVKNFWEATFALMENLVDTSDPDFAYKVISEWLSFPGDKFHPVIVWDGRVEYTFNYVS